MNILTRYLGKTIITYILLVILFLFGLHAFIGFMREFPNIGTGYYSLSKVVMYVFYMLPSDIYQFFPMAGLLGCVIALGLLASHSELIVMRASGFSIFDITRAIAKAVLILIIPMFIIGEVLAPMAQKHAIRKKTIEMSGGQTLLTQQGLWVRSEKSNFMHINFVSSDRELHGITKYEFDDDYKLKSASYAESGSYQDGKWIFKNIVQTNFYSDQTGQANKFIDKAISKTESISFDTQQWLLHLDRKLVGMAHIDPDQESLIKLYSYIKHRQYSGLNITNYESIFWQRVFAPLTTLVMVLLAIPFVFGPLRSTTMGLRMLVGIIVGFCFYILNQFVCPMSCVYQIPPILAAILPTILFSFINIGLLWIYRVN